MKKLIAFVLGIFNSPSFTAALHQQRREKKGGTGRAGGAVFALASLLVFLFPAPSMAAETLCNLVQFNETRINDNTWAAADKSHGFEVCANVYSAHVGSTPLSNCNAFGAFVPARVNESVSINFFNYNPYFGRTFYCEVTADGKCNTEPVQYYTDHAWVTHTMTLTQSDSIGFIIEWFIDGTQTRNYTAENYTVVKGSTAPTEYIPYDASCGLCPAGQVLQTYTSATGTVTQNGTPTPENPVYPTFYTQGDMVLRAVGDYKDSYDATTGKITRRVGVLVLKGDENFTLQSVNDYGIANFNGYTPGNSSNTINSSHFSTQSSLIAQTKVPGILRSSTNSYFIRIESSIASTVPAFQSWLAAQYAAGTPVTIYYYLGTTVEEDWAETSYCQSPIKIATTKYNNTAFSSVVTALNNAVDTIKTVVANTINQATAVANLQSGKQQRPDESCPAGKTCLLVEDMNGDPHWYEIVESYVAPNTLPAGYTELAYLQSSGTQWIDPDITITPANITTFKTEAVISNVTREWGSISGYSGSEGKLWYGLTAVSPYDFYYSTGTQEKTMGVQSNFQFYKFVIDAPNHSYNVYTESDELAANKTGITYSATASFKFYLFTYNPTAGTSAVFKPQKIKYAKFWMNGSLVRDFVPARRNSDGVLGMFDLANGQFYTNAGSGTFTAGPVAQ